MAIEVMSVGGSANLQSKTVTPSTSQQTVTPDSGYDGLSIVQVNAMPSGSLNTPSVNSSGLVTASVETSGYLAANTSKTLQLTTQGGKTVTPSTSQQTAVVNGRYTTGNVYVAGDSNLVSSNIKSGVSIFGVNGTANTCRILPITDVRASGAYIILSVPGLSTTDNIISMTFALAGEDSYGSDYDLISPAKAVDSQHTYFYANVTAMGETLLSTSEIEVLSGKLRFLWRRQEGSGSMDDISIPRGSVCEVIVS